MGKKKFKLTPMSLFSWDFWGHLNAHWRCYAAIWLPSQPFNIKDRIEMDIVVLEKKAFEQLIDETRRLTQRVELLSRKCQDKRLQKWLTGEDVCAILKISPRSLQTMRSKHKICYAQMGRKFYYRPEEVELVIEQSGKYNKV